MGLLEGGHKSIFSAFIHKLTNYSLAQRPFKLHLLFLVNVSRLKSRVAYVANFKKKVKVFSILKKNHVTYPQLLMLYSSRWRLLGARGLFWAAKLSYDHKVVMGLWGLLPPTFEQKMEVYCCWCVCAEIYPFITDNPAICTQVYYRPASSLRAEFQSFYGGELGHWERPRRSQHNKS